jgi:hypothetical protein
VELSWDESLMKCDDETKIEGEMNLLIENANLIEDSLNSKCFTHCHYTRS